jgi:hypothetical protein
MTEFRYHQLIVSSAAARLRVPHSAHKPTHIRRRLLTSNHCFEMLGVSLLIAAASYLFPVQSWWDGTTVVLPLGIVEGLIISTSDGISLPSPILAWFSIPCAYTFMISIFTSDSMTVAAPPVGARRFQHPQPPLSWSVPIRGTDYGPVCLQPGDVWSKSEDCLTLSVFAPKGTKKGDKLPVLLWIPGGGVSPSHSSIRTSRTNDVI